jgi:hypothetical protein
MTPFTERFQLCLARVRADDHGPVGTEVIEPALLELVELCRDGLATARQEVIACFVTACRTGEDLPDELFTFTMHHLRLPEVLDAVRLWAGEADPNSRAVVDRREFLWRLEEAFRDDWPDRDLWPSMNQSRLTGDPGRPTGR